MADHPIPVASIVVGGPDDAFARFDAIVAAARLKQALIKFQMEEFMHPELDKISRTTANYADILDEIIAGKIPNTEDNLRTIAIDLRQISLMAVDLEKTALRISSEIVGRNV